MNPTQGGHSIGTYQCAGNGSVGYNWVDFMSCRRGDIVDVYTGIGKIIWQSINVSGNVRTARCLELIRVLREVKWNLIGVGATRASLVYCQCRVLLWREKSIATE